MQGSSVILFIFVPKMWEVHIIKSGRESNRRGFSNYSSSMVPQNANPHNQGAASFNVIRNKNSLRALVNKDTSSEMRSSLPVRFSPRLHLNGSILSEDSELQKGSSTKKTVENSYDDIATI